MARVNSKDRILNMVYSLGAAVVIIGALCKINHYTPFGIDGSIILAIGLITEAIIFIIFAFDPPKAEYEWEKAYPELLDEERKINRAVKRQTQEIKDVEVSLSAKLDDMLKQANLDVGLFSSLRNGLDKFGNAVENINKTTDAASATQKYGDQLALAANHMESLNALYQVQLEHGKQAVTLNKKFIDDMQTSATESQKFANEMNSLTANLNNLNKVYGGMLSAMKA